LPLSIDLLFMTTKLSQPAGMKNRSSTRNRNAVKLALSKIRSLIDEQSVFPRGHLVADKVALALLSKGHTAAESVLLLVKAGFAEEAFGLSRTLVEVALNLRFIATRDSERRAKRFVDYFARWKMEQIRRAVKHFTGENTDGRQTPKYTRSQLRKVVPEYAKLVKLAQKYPEKTSWTTTRNRKASRGGAWRLANEPDRLEKSAGKPARWEFDYDWIYFWTSQYVHATVVSIESHAVVPREAFAIRIGQNRGEHTADLAVFNCALYVQKILILAYRVMGHPLPDKLARPLASLVTRMADEALLMGAL